MDPSHFLPFRWRRRSNTEILFGQIETRSPRALLIIAGHIIRTSTGTAQLQLIVDGALADQTYVSSNTPTNQWWAGVCALFAAG